MKPRLLLVLLAVLAVYAPRVARANGRFPRAQQIVSVPGDPSRVFLRATFGVLASFDGGRGWRWLCEDAIGFSGTWDPPLAATPDGRLWMGLEHGLRWTTDGCSMHAVPELEGELVSDLSVSGRDVVLVTSTPKKRAAVWRVPEHGPATRMGPGLEGFYFDTIDGYGESAGVLPARPPIDAAAKSRIWVSGVRVGEKPAPHLFRSDDGGSTLRELSPAWPTTGRVYIAAIDPKDAARILVRQLSERGSDLLLSEDAGQSFRVVLHTAGAMFGFTSSADGATMWAGSGDPAEGLYRSTDRGRTFAPLAKAPIFCLHRAADRLYACSNPFTEKGYAIGASPDDGVTLSPLLAFADVLGPVACDAGAGALCDKVWPAMHATFTTGTASASAPPLPAFSATAQPSAPDAGASPAPQRSSCGCRVAGHPAGQPTGLAVLGALLAGRAASRRRRRPGSALDQRMEPPGRRTSGRLTEKR